MDQKILEFYAGMKVPIHKMVFVGQTRRGLSAAAIEAAAEQLYGEIQDGLEVRQIRLAWEVYARARKVKTQADAKERDEMTKLRERLAWLEQPWYKRVFRRMK